MAQANDYEPLLQQVEAALAENPFNEPLQKLRKDVIFIINQSSIIESNSDSNQARAQSSSPGEWPSTAAIPSMLPTEQDQRETENGGSKKYSQAEIELECVRSLWLIRHTKSLRYPYTGFYGKIPKKYFGYSEKPERGFKPAYYKYEKMTTVICPPLTVADVNSNMMMISPNGPFPLIPQARNRGEVFLPQNTTFGDDVKPEEWDIFQASFVTSGILACHKLVVSNGEENEIQVTICNVRGHCIVFRNILKRPIPKPISVFLSHPMVLKLVCEADRPGEGYLDDVPSVTIAQLLWKAYLPSYADCNDAEYFTSKELNFKYLMRFQNTRHNLDRYQVGVQQVRLGMLLLQRTAANLFQENMPHESANILPHIIEMLLLQKDFRRPDQVPNADRFYSSLPRASKFPTLWINPLEELYAYMDSTPFIVQVRDFQLDPQHMPPNRIFQNTANRAQHAENIWQGKLLPHEQHFGEVNLGRFPHFCEICSAYDHRGKHCDANRNKLPRCQYPLCSLDRLHVVGVCPILHGICVDCGRRGHTSADHPNYCAVQLDGIFHWWSPLGNYTCIPYLDATERAKHLGDHQWKFGLHNAPRTYLQRVLVALRSSYRPLPKMGPMLDDPYFRDAPLWTYSPKDRYILETGSSSAGKKRHATEDSDDQPFLKRMRMEFEKSKQMIDSLAIGPDSLNVFKCQADLLHHTIKHAEDQQHEMDKLKREMAQMKNRMSELIKDPNARNEMNRATSRHGCQQRTRSDDRSRHPNRRSRSPRDTHQAQGYYYFDYGHGFKEEDRDTPSPPRPERRNFYSQGAYAQRYFHDANVHFFNEENQDTPSPRRNVASFHGHHTSHHGNQGDHRRDTPSPHYQEHQNLYSASFVDRRGNQGAYRQDDYNNISSDHDSTGEQYHHAFFSQRAILSDQGSYRQDWDDDNISSNHDSTGEQFHNDFYSQRAVSDDDEVYNHRQADDDFGEMFQRNPPNQDPDRVAVYLDLLTHNRHVMFR